MTWFNPEIFRKNDIRGHASRDLTSAFVEALGRAYGTIVRRAGGQRVVVGRDSRLSGPRIQGAFCDGVRKAGIDVLDLGVVPTPLVYFAVHTMSVDGGVSITGSHNPKAWNGFKFCLGQATMFGSQIEEMRVLIEMRDFEEGAGQHARTDLTDAYISDMGNRLNPLKRPVKVVIDGGNGAGGQLATRLYSAMGCEVVSLFCEPDGHFPNHHPDPTIEANLSSLKKMVAETAADIGLALDGDGDRIGAVDASGNVIWGDQLLTLFGLALLKEMPGARIIGEVKCSRLMYETLAAAGAKVEMWKVGHALIKARMQETGAVLAGEMSGHVFFKDRGLGYDDGLYAGARLIELVGAGGPSLEAQVQPLRVMASTPEIRIECSDDKKFALCARAADDFSIRYPVKRIDGLRIEFEHGWGLLRASNTQPSLVLRFEAETHEHLRAYQREVEQWIIDDGVCTVDHEGDG
ncbi:MAG: phosphomannomutase/phosphoglucomutase [Myxococcota bacterium]|nr:phosphomannomutase/phosphoglucomutase [Myxococcota bacterium]